MAHVAARELPPARAPRVLPRRCHHPVSLPLFLIGVVVALLLSHATLNIMSVIGLMLLAGIVAKNAISLVDFPK